MKCLFLALSLVTPWLTGVASAATFANVEVKVADQVAPKGAGIRTLYITLYDADAAQPRPYGAMKVDLNKDASGTVFKGTLDDNNIMLMGAGSNAPAALKIKARLDKDGSAGPDAAGDLVGIADKVKVGGNVVITIDKAL